MIFSEIYGRYFRIAEELIRLAQRGELSSASLLETVSEKGFAESVLSVPEALQSGAWPLIAPDFSTPIAGDPSMPLSLPEKRWLKTLLSDPRTALFAPDPAGLEDVEPLYGRELIVYYDRYLDGDPYSDPAYTASFRTALSAVKEKRPLLVSFRDRRGRLTERKGVPEGIEYSPRDDKFRLILRGADGRSEINMAGIERCGVLPDQEDGYPGCGEQPGRELCFELKDERNALERAMLAFSDLEKVTERVSGKLYRVTLRYRAQDEAEILIRILSFGPMIRVVSPDSFIELIRARLRAQSELDRAAHEG